MQRAVRGPLPHHARSSPHPRTRSLPTYSDAPPPFPPRCCALRVNGPRMHAGRKRACCQQLVMQLLGGVESSARRHPLLPSGPSLLVQPHSRVQSRLFGVPDPQREGTLPATASCCSYRSYRSHCSYAALVAKHLAGYVSRWAACLLTRTSWQQWKSC